jgi:hypothetical protein
MVVTADTEQTKARPFSQYVFNRTSYGSQAPRDSHMKWRHNSFRLKTQYAGGCRRSNHQRGSKLSLPPAYAHGVLGVGDVMFQIGLQVVQMALEHLRHFDPPALSRLRPTHPNQPLKNRRAQIFAFADVKLSFCFFLLIFYE